MGFILTILYLILSFLSPADMIPWAAPYRPLIIIGGLALIASVPAAILNQFTFRAWQIYLLPGLLLGMGMSRIWMGWIGGAYDALFEFGFAGIVLYLVAINVDSFARFRAVFTVFVLLALSILAVGFAAYYFGFDSENLILQQNIYQYEGWGPIAVEPRLRWYGFLNDPNDLAQNFLLTIPFLILPWIRLQPLSRFFLIVLPILVLLFGVYLTHSRGALIGLGALVAFAFKDKLGYLGSFILSGAAFTTMLGLNFAGARGFSLAGSARSRLDLWSDGLGMIKSSPIFGIGFNRYSYHADQTAHNSFLLPLAEIGLIGYFFWLGIIVLTVIELNTLSNLHPADESLLLLRRYSRAVRLALVAFLASSWFLSRSYTITLYMLLGLGVALAEMARRRGINTMPRGIQHALAVTVFCELATGFLVYLMVRSRSF